MRGLFEFAKVCTEFDLYRLIQMLKIKGSKIKFTEWRTYQR